MNLKKNINCEHELINSVLKMTANFLNGSSLEKSLDFIYENFQSYIPFNRLGFALINETKTHTVLQWTKSDRDIIVCKGFSGPLKGSSLQTILDRNQPRVINDLVEYMEDHPDSNSTELIIREGFRSSFTCPLVIDNEAVGFLFFSSDKINSYDPSHSEMFIQLSKIIAFNIQVINSGDTSHKQMYDFDIIQKSMELFLEFLNEVLLKNNASAHKNSMELINLVQKISIDLELDGYWEFCVAARLKHFGFLDPEVYFPSFEESNIDLIDFNKKSIDELMGDGIKTLENIPFLNNVCKILRSYYLPAKYLAMKYGKGKNSKTYYGIQILKVAIACNQLCRNGENIKNIFYWLKTESGRYDELVINSLVKIIRDQVKKKYLPVESLEAGMILLDDIVTENDCVLIPAGQIITSELIHKLLEYNKIRCDINQPICIANEINENILVY
jgi:GAF domain